MGVIGVYDYDFMKYENVIPNLECVKLYTYFHNRHEIAVLAPQLEPERYTKFYVRKEYDDGLYPKELFANNCVYGGRAFTPDKYSSLGTAIENTVPNMHLYDKYADHFGTNRTDKRRIKRILNCLHLRLAVEEDKPLSMEQLLRLIQTGRYTGIIFHDYDLAKIDNVYDIIYELSTSRNFKSHEGINPYPIGNKFPIQINSPTELQKWIKIQSMPEIFWMQYNGVMSDEVLYNLCVENRRMAKQVYYKIDASCSSEEEFLMDILPKIFVQVLFLRKQNTKILLKYSKEKILTKELRDFIDLLNCWLSFSWQENFLPLVQTLYNFCRSNKKLHYINWAFLTVSVSTDDIRHSFQYIRERNYNLFKQFYELDSVIYNGGTFYDEWKGTKCLIQSES